MEALWSGSIDGWEEPAPVVRPRRRPRLVPPPHAAPPETQSESTERPVELEEIDGSVGEPEETDAVLPGSVAAPRPISELPVEVVRSANRRKSVSARIVDGRIVIRMPKWMSKAQERDYVTSLVAKLERQHSATAVDLPERARLLARRYDLPEPRSIRWVGNQRQRWGSCTPSTGEIRISDRIAAFPEWVVDGVIVHELAHLVHLHHTKDFWALAHRYPKTERAYGFLIAKQLTDDEVC